MFKNAEYQGVLPELVPLGVACENCGYEVARHGLSGQCPLVIRTIKQATADREASALGQQVGDVNSNARGSGARYNAGKPDLSLIPINTLFDEARVWMYGRDKYAAWNWAKGMPWSIPLACAMRHLAAWQAGEDNDPETGLPHIAHAMCNLRMLTLYATQYPEGDDRPKDWLGKETTK